MSERTAAVAVDTLFVTGMGDAEFGMEMLALDEALDFDFERWCRVIGLDADDPSTFARFRLLHQRYAEAWTEMGQQDFHRTISPLVAKWARILGGKE